MITIPEATFYGIKVARDGIKLTSYGNTVAPYGIKLTSNGNRVVTYDMKLTTHGNIVVFVCLRYLRAWNWHLMAKDNCILQHQSGIFWH